MKATARKLEEARRILERTLDRLADGSMDVQELVISKRLTRAPEAYRKDTATAVVARQLDRSGVKLRPGEIIGYIVTDAGSKFPDDRFRAFTLWEAWHGYDVRHIPAGPSRRLQAFRALCSPQRPCGSYAGLSRKPEPAPGAFVPRLARAVIGDKIRLSGAAGRGDCFDACSSTVNRDE